MDRYGRNNIREATLIFHKGKYAYKHKKDEGRPPFERCIEVPWVLDKINQCNPSKEDKLFDFGCNKAEYIMTAKNDHSLQTYGIDGKPAGKKFVDNFFSGIYNKKLKRRIQESGPYRITTGISAIEHAGNNKHPNIEFITNYQKDICNVMIDISQYCFISVPFGQRPGWAKDKSRKNLYQFDIHMLDHLQSYSLASNRIYLEEIYKLDGEYWVVSDRDVAASCIYRDGKSGASAVALISIWRNDETNRTT